VGDFVRNAKYITAFPIAKFLQQDVLPEKPPSLESYNLFRGAIAKIIRARLISRRDHKAARFFFGLLQGVKRACNVIPREFIEKSKEKHLLTLTTPSLSIDDEYLSGEFSKLNDKLWRGIKLRPAEFLHWTEPSKNAAFENSRKEGGQDTGVREFLEIPTRPNPDSYPSPDDLEDPTDPYIGTDDDFTFIESIPVPGSDSDAHTRGQSLYAEALKTMSYFDELHSMHETNNGVKELRGVRLGYTEKRRLLSELYKTSKGLNSPIKCLIVPLAEPLKVRTISAGEDLPYYMAKPFQKVAWRWLRNFPQFIVIGEPLTSDILSRMLDRESQLQRYIDERNTQRKKHLAPYRMYPIAFFVSGDYSAATDNLKIEYTLESFDRLSNQLLAICRKEFNQDFDVLVEYLHVCRKLLEPHDLVYNDRRGILMQICVENKIPFDHVDGMLTVRQRNGQLMGSPISFPFLCAINFVCYWTSVNRYTGLHCPHRLLPVLVNGDDILFRSNIEHYAIWKEVIAEVGFTLSLGKNYTHPTYLTINSELFEYRVRPGEEEFLKLDYYNVGLLMAQSKGRLADPRRKLSLVELYASSVGCAINKPQAHLRFLHYNKEQLNLATERGKYNMFLPIQFGGLGFPVYDEIKATIYITKFQRRFAAFLLNRTNECLSLGIYPKKYFSALLTDTTPLASVIRRHGFPKMMLSVNQGEVGWKRYVQPTATTMGPLSAVQEISLDPTSEYRHPARSLLKEFNREHFKAFHTTEESYLSKEMTDDELLLGNRLLLWVEDNSPPRTIKTWLPSGTADRGVQNFSPETGL
jgi:hypothetical protein